RCGAVSTELGSTWRDGRFVEEAEAVTEGIGGVENPLAPKLYRDRLVDVAAPVTDPLACPLPISHRPRELPERPSLLRVVEIAIGGGIVTGQFKPTKRVMAPSGRYTLARSPQRLVVEADGSFDVRDTDQNSGHASAHGSSPSFITGSTLAIVRGRDRACNP